MYSNSNDNSNNQRQIMVMKVQCCYEDEETVIGDTLYILVD